MSATAQSMMREYAAHEWPGLNHKGRMAALARRLGLGHRRVRSLYQNEVGIAVRADEMSQIRQLRRQQEIEGANQHDLTALQARVARLEALLLAQDAEFHHDHVAAFRQGAGVGRREDGADKGWED